MSLLNFFKTPSRAIAAPIDQKDSHLDTLPNELASDGATPPGADHASATQFDSNLPTLGSDAALDADTLARHVPALSDARLVSLAVQCRAMQREILKKGGKEALIGWAVETSHAQGLEPAALLERRLADLEAEYQEVMAGVVRIAIRRKSYSDRMMPLWIAVGSRCAGLESERKSLESFCGQKVADDAYVNSFSEYQKLLDAGLTAEQVKTIGGPADPAARVREQKAAAALRLPLIEAEVAKLTAFSADKNVRHLAGLGFDALIEKAEQTPEEESP